MKNFLMYDMDSGGRFFVQCSTELEIENILLESGFDPDNCVLEDVLEDEEAEMLGYDTY